MLELGNICSEELRKNCFPLDPLISNDLPSKWNEIFPKIKYVQFLFAANIMKDRRISEIRKVGEDLGMISPQYEFSELQRMAERVDKEFFKSCVEKTLENLLCQFMSQGKNSFHKLNHLLTQNSQNLNTNSIPSFDGVNAVEQTTLPTKRAPFDWDKQCEDQLPLFKKRKMENKKENNIDRNILVKEVLLNLLKISPNEVLEFTLASLGYEDEISQHVVREAFGILLENEIYYALQLAQACLQFTDKASKEIVKIAYYYLQKKDGFYAEKFADACREYEEVLKKTWLFS